MWQDAQDRLGFNCPPPSSEWFGSVQVSLVQESEANIITLNFRIIAPRDPGGQVTLRLFDITDVRRVGERHEENGFLTVTDYIVKLRELGKDS